MEVEDTRPKDGLKNYYIAKIEELQVSFINHPPSSAKCIQCIVSMTLYPSALYLFYWRDIQVLHHSTFSEYSRRKVPRCEEVRSPKKWVECQRLVSCAITRWLALVTTCRHMLTSIELDYKRSSHFLNIQTTLISMSLLPHFNSSTWQLEAHVLYAEGAFLNSGGTYTHTH